MAYKYRNTKTNNVITTTNKVSGKNWAPIEDAQKSPVGDDSLENDLVDETSEDDPVEDNSEEESVAEEVPAAKPKATRRSKK